MHGLDQVEFFIVAGDSVHRCILGLEIRIVSGADLKLDDLVDAVQRVAVGHGAALCAADDVDVLDIAVLGQQEHIGGIILADTGHEHLYIVAVAAVYRKLGLVAQLVPFLHVLVGNCAVGAYIVGQGAHRYLAGGGHIAGKPFVLAVQHLAAGLPLVGVNLNICPVHSRPGGGVHRYGHDKTV